MAIQRRRASIQQDGALAYVDQVYDDTNMIVTRAEWNNGLSVPVRVWVIKQDGVILLDTTLQPGVTGGRNLTNPQRYNVETESPSVNLAT